MLTANAQHRCGIARTNKRLIRQSARIVQARLIYSYYYDVQSFSNPLTYASEALKNRCVSDALKKRSETSPFATCSAECCGLPVGRGGQCPYPRGWH